MNAKSRFFIAFLVIGSPSAFPDNERYSPLPEDTSKWTNRFYVLLKDDVDTRKTVRLVSDIQSKNTSNSDITSFRGLQPAYVSTFLAMRDRQSGERERNREDARSKLGRYLLVTFSEGTDLAAIFSRFQADENIEYFGMDELLFSQTPLGIGGPESMTVSTIITENKSWGFNLVRAGQGHTFEHGHSYIGVVDTGLNPNNPEFIDYTGNTWKGGNFHPAAAFRLGSAIGTNGTLANPYTGLAAFRKVDEYHIYTLPGDLNCDGPDSNTTNEVKTAIHGSHVTGIVAANATNGVGVNGVCRHCPLAIAQVSFPYACETGTHPDGSNYESAWSLTIVNLMAGTAFLVDIGVQVVNLSSGEWNYSPPNDHAYCATHQSSPACLVIEYAEDRDVALVAAAGDRTPVI